MCFGCPKDIIVTMWPIGKWMELIISIVPTLNVHKANQRNPLGDILVSKNHGIIWLTLPETEWSSTLYFPAELLRHLLSTRNDSYKSLCITLILKGCIGKFDNFLLFVLPYALCSGRTVHETQRSQLRVLLYPQFSVRLTKGWSNLPCWATLIAYQILTCR